MFLLNEKKMNYDSCFDSKVDKIHGFKYSFHLSLYQYRKNLSSTHNFFADNDSPVCTDHGCYFRFSERRIFFEKSGIPVFAIF